MASGCSCNSGDLLTLYGAKDSARLPPVPNSMALLQKRLFVAWYEKHSMFVFFFKSHQKNRYQLLPIFKIILYYFFLVFFNSQLLRLPLSLSLLPRGHHRRARCADESTALQLEGLAMEMQQAGLRPHPGLQTVTF